MLKIYHNPRCAKSRAGLKYLIDNSIEHEIVEYLKTNLITSDIKSLILKTGLQSADLVRTQEDYYKKNLKGKNISNDEWYKILADNPKLLQRPIVVNGNKAVLAQPPENINKII